MGSLSQSTPFGKPMREHFLFEENYKNFNHGSFGTYPNPVRSTLHHFQSLAEAAPDKFLRYQSADPLLASRTAIANLLNCPLDTCVFLQNATLGINTVLRNLVYAPGDVIIYFDTIYGACEKTIASILETTPNVRAEKVGGYEFPCGHGEIVERFLEAVRRVEAGGSRARVAVFDTICALPGVRFPFERLTEECRRLGVLSCVDAAHGVGQVPLDLGGLDPDFLVSNCHKWLYTPRGCALFYVPFRNQSLIRTTYPTSHGYIPQPPPPQTHPSPKFPPIRNPLPIASPTATPFITLFQFVATMDNTPYYCVPTALKFRAEVCGGEANLMSYLRASMKRGGDRVAAMLGTAVMANDADGKGGNGEKSGAGALRDCAFANVRLPLIITKASTRLNPHLHSHSPPSEGDVAVDEVGTVVDYMQSTFLAEFDTFIAVYEYKGCLWTRLSGQVYLEMGDWEWCAGVLKEVCERVRRGGFRGDGWGVADKGAGAGAGDGEREVEGEGESENGVKDVEGRFKGLGVEME